MMDSVQPARVFGWKSGRAPVFSAVAHAVAILGLLGLLHRHPHLEAFRLPGTRSGVQFLTYYSPGSTHASVNPIPTRIIEKQTTAPTFQPIISPPRTENSAALESKQGDATAGQSGLGDGNITIALQKYFPYPKPSLTSLPAGAAGDVILKAVIDEHGKISELTLLAGLGPAIDDAVIQTVNQWVYTPAMKDGVPVPSIEELHFHYEKRG
jgi:periplasmic protein TonB